MRQLDGLDSLFLWSVVIALHHHGIRTITPGRLNVGNVLLFPVVPPPAPVAQAPAPPAEAPPEPDQEQAEPDGDQGDEDQDGDQDQDITPEQAKTLGKQFFDELQDEWAQEYPEAKGFKCGGEGGTPGPCAEGGNAPSGGKPSGGNHEAAHAATHQEAEKKAKGLAQRLKELPAAVGQKIKKTVKEKYDKLEKRYGKGAARTIMAAGTRLAAASCSPVTHR